MSQDDIAKAMVDLCSRISFGAAGGGGNGGGGRNGGVTQVQSRGMPSASPTRPSLPSQRPEVDNKTGNVVNSQAMKETQEALGRAWKDPEGCYARPNSRQGDTYSGHRDYGGCHGR